ncbi:hypothetical protein B5M09_004369 [Aphanomyces astaci]|uniref:Uncharacterized protein n=1 Tax=Aphanomyces astaci TaxID=112090 RepID=A0A3R7WLR9_APHAT|nr:hypothetical protein B5M09_004369 [Aphanomyces astaci]
MITLSSLEVDIAARAKTIENMVNDQRLDFKRLASECAASRTKTDEIVQMIDTKMQRLEAFEMDATKALESLPRVETQTIALLKWKGMVEYDMQSATLKLDSVVSAQDKWTRLERQVSDIELKLQRLPTMDDLVETLTKRVQELERQVSKTNAAHAVKVAVNKAMQTMDDRVTKRIDDATTMHDTKTASFVKTLNSQREHAEKSMQFALDASISDIHVEIDQVTKRMETRVHDLHVSNDTRVTALTKRIAAVEVAIADVDSNPTSDITDEQHRKLQTRLDSCVTKQQVGAVVAEHIESSVGLRRMETSLAKTQQDHDRKWTEVRQELSTTQDDLARVHGTIASIQSAIHKTSSVENQVLRAKLLQSVTELDELHQVKHDMTAHFDRRSKEHDAAVAALTAQVAAADKKREDDVATLTKALTEKSVQVASTQGKLTGLQECWNRDVEQMQSTRASMLKAQRESADMRTALQKCQGDVARQNVEKQHLVDAIRRLTSQWTTARDEAVQAKGTLHQATQQHTGRVRLLESTIAKLQVVHASTMLRDATVSSSASREVARLTSDLASTQVELQSVQEELQEVSASKLKVEAQLNTCLLQMQSGNRQDEIGRAAQAARQVALDNAQKKMKELMTREHDVATAVEALLTTLNMTRTPAVEPSTMVDTLQLIQNTVREWHTQKLVGADNAAMDKLQRLVDANQVELTAQQVAWEGKLQAYAGQLQAVLDQKADVEADLAQLKKQLELELARQQQVEVDAAAAIEAHIATERQLQDKVFELEAMVAAITSQKTSMESNLTALQATHMNATRDARGTSDSVIASLKQKLKDAQAKHDDATQQAAALEAKLKGLQDSNKTLTDEYNSVCHVLDQCNVALNATEEDVKTLQLQLTQAQYQVQEREAKLQTALAKIDCVTEDKDRAESTLLQLQTELATVQHAQVDAAKTDQSQLDQVRAKVDVLVQEKQAVEAKLLLVAAREEALQEERAQLKLQSDARELEVQSQVKTLTDALKAEQDATATREVELNALIEHITITTPSSNHTVKSNGDGNSVATLKAAIDNVLEATVVKTQTLDAVVQLLHKCVAHDDNDGPTTVTSFVLANLPELQPVLCQIKSLHVEKTQTTARVRELVGELQTRDQEQEQLQLEVDAQRATIAALQHAKDMMETNSAVSIQDLEATKAQWKESDILHQATIKTLTADYDKVVCREKLVREQLESLVQKCQSELDAMQANTIDDLEEKVACLEADIQRYATDLVQHEAAQAKTMADIDKEQEGMQRLQRDLAMLRNQLSMAPSVLYHINHMHGAITAPGNSAVGRDRARIATMQSQLAAEVEVTALQLTLKGLDISYVVNSIQRLPQLAERLAQLSVTINNTTVVVTSALRQYDGDEEVPSNPDNFDDDYDESVSSMEASVDNDRLGIQSSGDGRRSPRTSSKDGHESVDIRSDLAPMTLMDTSAYLQLDQRVLAQHHEDDSHAKVPNAGNLQTESIAVKQAISESQPNAEDVATSKQHDNGDDDGNEDEVGSSAHDDGDEGQQSRASMDVSMDDMIASSTILESSNERRAERVEDEGAHVLGSYEGNMGNSVEALQVKGGQNRPPTGVEKELQAIHGATTLHATEETAPGDSPMNLDIVQGLMLEKMQQHSADQHFGHDDSFDDSFDAPASPVHGSSSRHDDSSVEQNSDGEEALSEAFGRDKVAVPPEPFHGRGAPDDTTESVEMSRLPRENIIVSHCEVVDQVQLSADEQDDGSYVDEMDESLNESQTNDTDVAGVDVKVQSRYPSDAKEFLDSHEVSFDDSKDDRAIVSKVQTVHGDEGDYLTSDDKDISGDVNQDLDVSQSMSIQPIVPPIHAVEGTGPELGHGEFFTGTDEAKAKAAVVSKLKADATDLEDVERLLTEQSQTATATSKDDTGFDNSFDASFDDDAGHDDETHQSEDEDLSDFEDGDHVGGEVYEIDTKATHVGGQGGPLKSLLGDSGHVAVELQIAATTLLEPNAPLGGSVHHHDSGEEVDSDVGECDEDMEQSGEESRSRDLESPPRLTSSSDSHHVALHEAGRFVQGSVELHSTTAINGKPSRLHADDVDLDDVARLMVEQGQLGTARQSKTRGASLGPLDDGELSGPDEDDGSVTTDASERGEEFASHPVDPSAVGRADSAAIATRNDHSIHSLSSAVVDTFHSNHVTTSDHSPLSGDSDELGSSTQSILSCREVRLSAQSIPSFGFNQPGQHTKPNITLSGDALSIHVPSPVDDKDGDILQDSFSDQDESVDLSRGEDGILSGKNDSSLHTSSPLAAADLNQGGKTPTSLHGEAPLDSLRSQTFSFQTGLSSRDVDTDEVERRMMDKTQYSARAFGDASELKGSAPDDDVASADEELSDPDDDGESPDTVGTYDVHGGKALVTQKAGDHARVLSHNSTQSGPVDPRSSANAMESLGLDDHSDDDDNDDEDEHHVMLDNTSDNTGHGVTASRAHQFGLSLNDQDDLDALSDDDDIVDSSPDGRDPTQAGVGERVEDRAITASDVRRPETDEIQRDNLPSVTVEPSKELSPGKSPPRLSPKLAPLDKMSWRGLPRIASDLAHLEHLTLNGSPPLASVPGRDDDDFDEVSGQDDSVEGSVDDNSHENDHEERNQNDVNEDGNDDDALPSFGDAVPPHPSVVTLSTAGLQYVATSDMLLPHDNDGLENSLDLEHSFDASDDDMDDVTQHSMDNVSDGDEIHHGAAQVDLPSRRYDAALDVSSDGDAMERSRDDSSADDTSPSKPMSISLSQRLIQAKLRTLEPKPDLTQRIEYTEHDSPSCSVEGSMELSHELEPVDATSDDENEDRDDESENDVVTQTPRTSVDSNLRDQTLVPTDIPSTIPTRHAHDDDDAEVEELMRGHISGSTVKQAYGVTGMTPVVSSGMTSSPWMQNASTLSTQSQRDPYSAVNGRDDLEDSNDDYESYVTQATSGNKIVSSDLATSHVNNESDDMEALMHENLSTIAFKAHGTQGAASPSISLGPASSISQDGVKNNDKTLSHDLSHDGNVPTGHVRTTTPSTTSHTSDDEDEVEALMRGHIPTPAAKAQRTMGRLEAAQSLTRDALTLPASRQNTPYRNADEGVDLDESQDDVASDHASDDSGPSPLKKLPNGNVAMPTGKRPLSALRSLPQSKLSPLQPLSKLPLPSVVSSLGRRNFADDESLDNDEQPLGPKVIIHSNFDDDEDEFGASASDHSIVVANQSMEAADNLSPPLSPHAITTTPSGHDVQILEGTVSPQLELHRTTPSSPPTSPIPQTNAYVTSDRISTATTAAPSSPPRSPSRRHGTTDDDDDGAYSDSFEFEESVASDEETS